MDRHNLCNNNGRYLTLNDFKISFIHNNEEDEKEEIDRQHKQKKYNFGEIHQQKYEKIYITYNLDDFDVNIPLTLCQWPIDRCVDHIINEVILLRETYNMNIKKILLDYADIKIINDIDNIDSLKFILNGLNDDAIRYHAYRCACWGIINFPTTIDEILLNKFPVIGLGTQQAVYDCGNFMLKRIIENDTYPRSEYASGFSAVFAENPEVYAETYYVRIPETKDFQVDFNVQEKLRPVHVNNPHYEKIIRNTLYPLMNDENWFYHWNIIKYYEWGVNSVGNLKIFDFG